MNKKVLSAEEKLKKYGRSIIGVGIIYLIATVFLRDGSNLINSLIRLFQIALLLCMMIGVGKRKKWGVTAAWAFEGYMGLILILAFLGKASMDIVGIIVMIFLPIDIKNFSKALEESNSKNQSKPNANV